MAFCSQTYIGISYTPPLTSIWQRGQRTESPFLTQLSCTTWKLINVFCNHPSILCTWKPTDSMDIEAMETLWEFGFQSSVEKFEVTLLVFLGQAGYTNEWSPNISVGKLGSVLFLFSSSGATPGETTVKIFVQNTQKTNFTPFSLLSWARLTLLANYLLGKQLFILKKGFKDHQDLADSYF